MLSVIISLLIASPALFSGAAVGQSYDSGYAAGYGDGNYDATGSYAGDIPDSLNIPGIEGLQGFSPGENILSLAVIPVTQQDSALYFQVIGFAITSPASGQSVVYSLDRPIPGLIDPATNTVQIDLSNLAAAIGQAGYIDSSQVYATIRTDPRVVVIDVDMSYQGFQGSQAIFNVSGVNLIPPDGQMQAFSMQQPTQLIIDPSASSLYMVAFPQLINTFSGFYGVTYPQVLPIVYAQPVPVLAPVFVPFIRPFPVFSSAFVPFNPFLFHRGFLPFFNHRVHGVFPIRDRFFARNEIGRFHGGEFAFGHPGGRVQIAPGLGPGRGIGEFHRPGFPTVATGGRGFQPGRDIGDIRQPGFQPGRTVGPETFPGRLNVPSTQRPGTAFRPGGVGQGAPFIAGGNRFGVQPGRGPGSLGGSQFFSGGGVRRAPVGGAGFGGDIRSGVARTSPPSFTGGGRIGMPAGGGFSGGLRGAPVGAGRSFGGGSPGGMGGIRHR